MKAILAVAAGGERYRPGHYGAITKVRARGNVTENGNLTRCRESRGRTAKHSFLSPPFQETDSAEIWLPGRSLGRLERLTGR